MRVSKDARTNSVSFEHTEGEEVTGNGWRRADLIDKIENMYDIPVRSKGRLLEA